MKKKTYNIRIEVRTYIEPTCFLGRWLGKLKNDVLPFHRQAMWVSCIVQPPAESGTVRRNGPCDHPALGRDQANASSHHRQRLILLAGGGWMGGWMGGWVGGDDGCGTPFPITPSQKKTMPQKSTSCSLTRQWNLFTGILTFFQLRVPEPLPSFSACSWTKHKNFLQIIIKLLLFLLLFQLWRTAKRTHFCWHGRIYPCGTHGTAKRCRTQGCKVKSLILGGRWRVLSVAKR